MKKILLLTFTISTFLLNAQTTIENFNYGSSPDTLTNPLIGGTLWKRHSGTTALTYNSTSLSYSGYSSSGVGGSVSFINTTKSEDANRPTIQYTSGSVYASFLLNVSTGGGATGDYNVHFVDSFGANPGTNFRGRIFIKDGTNSNTFKIGLSKGSAAASAVFTSTDYALNTPVLVVLKYSFNTSFSDTVYAFVFTSGIPSIEPAPTLTATVAVDIALSDFAKIAGFAIRQGGTGTAAGTVDGIRISNSWGTSALPVKLTSFNATINNKQTNLSWTTASEINNKGFEIERSLDGFTFEKIAFVKGNGNSSRANKYTFIDANHSSAFYRLKQIDFDGKFEYSSVVLVKANDFTIDITPNPFNDIIEINSNGTLTNVELLDITGKVVLTEVINNSKGTLNTVNLKNGIYFVRINNGENVITKRLIKN